MECYAFLRNVHDKMADGKTTYKKNRVQFNEPLILFGASVSCKPISLKDEAKAASIQPQSASLSPHTICVSCGRSMVRRFAPHGLRAAVVSIFLNSDAANFPQGETLSKMKKKRPSKTKVP